MGKIRRQGAGGNFRACGRRLQKSRRVGEKPGYKREEVKNEKSLQKIKGGEVR